MSSQSRRYALLVGVNQYPDNPLSGCVPDVLGMKNYLDTRSEPIQTEILTASRPTDLSSSHPAEHASIWPTRDNFISHMEAIASSACSGDFIYIHYSGHGTTIPPTGRQGHSHKSTADLALVLLGPDGISVRYIYGSELAHYLLLMVSKGARVSLVLDCCFSGSVLRGHDQASRFLPYNADVDAASSPLAQKLIDMDSDTGNGRDGSLLPNWLVNPEGYTILTACGPHEEAKELRLANQGRVGALSYFIRRALLRVGNGDVRLSDIYLSVCARFADCSCGFDAKQMPMFFGNKDLSFFGELSTDMRLNTIAVFRFERHVMIRAGQAHGVADGDRFDLYPLESAPSSPGTEAAVVHAQVAEALPLTCRLVGFPDPSIPSRVTAGWKAKLVSRPSLQPFPIELASDLPHLDSLLKASTKRKSLALQVTGQDPWPNSFCVVLNGSGEYEIRDESSRVVSVFPALPTAHLERGEPGVLDVLEHLVRFRQIQAISNSRSLPSFQQSFAIRVRSRGVLQDTANVIHAADGEDLELEIQNKGQAPIYVHIFDMGPSWQVENIFGGDYDVILPRDVANGCSGEEMLTLTMSIPKQLLDAGMDFCEDMIKIFITDGPTSFALLDMTKLSDTSSLKSGVEDLRNLSVLNPDGTDGEGRGQVDNWVAMNIRIRTASLAG